MGRTWQLVVLGFALAVIGCRTPRGAFAPEPEVAPMVPPPVGAPDPVITQYLDHLERDIGHAEDRVHFVGRTDDRAAKIDARAALRERKERWASERDRLTRRDNGMIAGGATLLGVGGASLIASAVLAMSYGLSGVSWVCFSGNCQRSPNDDYKYASIATLLVGVAGVSTGVPMLVLGVKREPRPAEGHEPPAYSSSSAPAPAPGMTLVWSF